MTCPRAHELIHAFLDGVISPPDRHTLDAHLAGCAGCRGELESTRSLMGALADAPRRRLSADFDAALHARLAELGPRRSPWPVWGRLWQMNSWRFRPALVPVAAALAAVIAFQTLPLSRPDVETARANSVYLTRCLREHESDARWRGLPHQ